MSYTLHCKVKDDDGDLSQEWVISLPQNKALAKAVTNALKNSDELDEVVLTTLQESEVTWDS